MAKTPPVPPANQNPQGEEVQEERRVRPDERKRNLKQQGRQGNTWQNTHHQGHQQDR
jgi:hypothetical protein